MTCRFPVGRQDLVVAMPSDLKHGALIQASAAWRKVRPQHRNAALLPITTCNKIMFACTHIEVEALVNAVGLCKW